MDGFGDIGDLSGAAGRPHHCGFRPPQAVALIEKMRSNHSPRTAPLASSRWARVGQDPHPCLNHVYGMVSGLRVPLPNLAPSDQELEGRRTRAGRARCVREGNGEFGPFRRGVSAHPALDEPVYLASPADLALVYARPSVATARIGTLHQDAAVPAYILTNELFGKHFSVVGTTEIGEKSCVVAAILSAVIERNPQTPMSCCSIRMSEYRRGLRRAVALCLKTPATGCTCRSIGCSISKRSPRSCSARIASPSRPRSSAKRSSPPNDPISAKSDLNKAGIPVDTPVPYRMSDVLRHLDAAMGALDRPENVGALSGADLEAAVRRCRPTPATSFVFGQRRLTVRDELSVILSQLLRIPVDGKAGNDPRCLGDPVGSPQRGGFRVVPGHLRFRLVERNPGADHDHLRGSAPLRAARHRAWPFEPAKRALVADRQVKGRKYGVSLCVVTQRPVGSGPRSPVRMQTRPSRCRHDQSRRPGNRARRGARSLGHGLMNFLPALRNGEAIAAGEGVSMPMRVCFDLLPENRRCPKSATASFTGSWSQESEGGYWSKSAAIERWRRAAIRTAA